MKLKKHRWRRWQVVIILLLVFSAVVGGLASLWASTANAWRTEAVMVPEDNSVSEQDMFDGDLPENEPSDEAEALPTVLLAGEEALIPIHWETDLFYDPLRARLVFKPRMDIGTITASYFFDEYNIIFTEAAWRYRRIPVNDAYVREIILEGQTLTLVCEGEYFAEYGEAENTAYIQLSDPKAQYETVVIIDAGHGGDDEGAIINGIREKNINLDIVLRLLDMFDNERVLLLPTRTDDTRIFLEDRYALANRMGDYFISVHINVDERSSRSNGTQTFYGTHEKDTPITSHELAQVVQNALVERLESRDRGVEESNEYRLLINTVLPAVITEVLFFSNADEFERLMDPACRQEIANALCDAINQLPPARTLSE